jgi:uncharacterized membrane protein YfhO
MIDKRSQEILQRQQRTIDLQSQVYRNPSPNFFDYQKKKEYATILTPGNKIINKTLNY